MVTYNLQFERFRKESLARYVVAEAPETSLEGDENYAVMNELAEDAIGDIHQVGVLYALLGAIFATNEKLDNLAAEVHWFESVKALADWLVGDKVVGTSPPDGSAPRASPPPSLGQPGVFGPFSPSD